MTRLSEVAARVAALVPAAGEGVRLGRGPKALVELCGKSLLERAVGAFEGHVDEVMVAVSASMRETVEARLEGRVKLVAGGATRQASVLNLLEATDADLVLIHDAARPFLSSDVIKAVTAETERAGAVSVVTPVADTLIELATGDPVDRQRLRAVQTPQGFRRALLLEAHHHALSQKVEATDDAGLVRLLGHPVALVEGSGWLMKVTTPADLELARALAVKWDQHAR